MNLETAFLTEIDAQFEEYGVPQHTRGGILRFVRDGIIPGSFLQAVISNDLRESFGRADDINRAALFDIVRWFWNKAPHDCWGSPDAMFAWEARRHRERVGPIEIEAKS